MASPRMALVSSSLVFLLYVSLTIGWTQADPTDGFVEQPLTQSNLLIQKPYDVPQQQRYSFTNGVHQLWVYSTDQPFSSTSPTMPRTEIRINDYDYSSGVWQFEGNAYVPEGTSGVCIMQVFGGSPQATTLQLRVYDGSLMYYRTTVVLPNVYNKWFRLNVIHDVGKSKVQIYIDGVLKLEENGRGGTSHYFKCGVYAQEGDSNCMESRWKGIKVFKKA